MKLSLEKSFPFATFGRRETFEEMTSKWIQQREYSHWLSGPQIGLIVPLENSVSISELRRCLQCISEQSLPHWICVVVSIGENKKAESLVKSFGDERLRFIQITDSSFDLDKELCQVEWVGTVESTSVLSPVALYQFCLEIERNLEADIVFSHEILCDEDWQNATGYFTKPDAHWFNLIHFNAIGKFWLAKRELVAKDLWGLLKGRAAEHEVFLRWCREKRKFQLIPQFLYYSQTISGDSLSVSPGFSFRVEDHLKEVGFGGRVLLEKSADQTLARIHPSAGDQKDLISIIVAFRDQVAWTLECIGAVEKAVGQTPVELVLVDNGSSEENLRSVQTRLSTLKIRAKLVSFPGSFHFARMHNWAIREHCQGNLLMFLNNDVFLNGKLDELAAWARLQWVGTVGMLLRYPHGGIQHDGIRATFGDSARMARIGHFPVPDHFSRFHRTVFANSFAACMVRRDVFELVGGLRENDLVNGFGDVAFNFECVKRNLMNLFLGSVEGVHVESGSRGPQYEYWEECAIEREYPEIIIQMLRSDLGWNRVPAMHNSILSHLGNAFKAEVRNRTPWLLPMKPHLSRLLRVAKIGTPS